MPAPLRSTSAPRAVSLLPSATEIVAVLGCLDRLVGRSHECDYPTAVTSLPICTAPRVDLSGSSRDIDTKVKRALRDATSIYQVLEDELRNLRPDVILTQDQCEVCAVSLDDVTAALKDWAGCQAEVVSLKPASLGDVFTDIGRVAAALGLAEEDARRVTDNLEQRVAAVASSSSATINNEKPTVACIEWTDPLMAAGNWVPELVTLAGGTDVFGVPGEHAPWITLDALIDADPDVLVFMPCGFDLARTEREARLLVDRSPALRDMRAVRAGRVFATDANAYFNRPGPRLVDSLEILRSLLDEGATDHAVEGDAARRLRL